ncbi:PaaI family thioesterase [Mangrovicoccus algicola]|uniref:PaaI family thioesterase n=1 Tax=Mangrovicoccus algicola TaxID=2771008 RepID=A0A8J7CME4_9RHOB|nr:PaaI family thioesterase [Mangrovicoccus algicola]MBE3640306.1 PaaI family thioesterase [Mangrovicoccus algicola]
MSERAQRYGTVSAADRAGMSGLDFLRATIDGRLPEAPIRGLMNGRVSAAEEGRVEMLARPTEDHLNPFGAVQGGWYGVILDTVLGFAVISRLGPGFFAPTLEFKVNITRAIPLGMQVRAVGIASHVGGRTGVSTAEIRGVEDDRLYANGSTTCINLTP